MSSTGNATWVDGTSGTLITAAKLNAMEAAHTAAVGVVDAGSNLSVVATA